MGSLQPIFLLTSLLTLTVLLHRCSCFPRRRDIIQEQLLVESTYPWLFEPPRLYSDFVSRENQLSSQETNINQLIDNNPPPPPFLSTTSTTTTTTESPQANQVGKYHQSGQHQRQVPIGKNGRASERSTRRMVNEFIRSAIKKAKWNDLALKVLREVSIFLLDLALNQAFNLSTEKRESKFIH